MVGMRILQMLIGFLAGVLAGGRSDDSGDPPFEDDG
jgi:hypothetical protein